jgi:hypothetical protein
LRTAQRSRGLVSLTGEARTGLALAFRRGEHRIGPAPLGGFLDCAINPAEAPVEVGNCGGQPRSGRQSAPIKSVQPCRGLYSLIVSLGLFHNSPQFVIRVQQRHGMFAAAHDQETMKFKVIPNARHSTFIGWLKFFPQLFKRWCLRFARHDIVRLFVAPA